MIPLHLNRAEAFTSLNDTGTKQDCSVQPKLAH